MKSILNKFSKLSYVDQQDLLNKLKSQVYESKPILVHKTAITNCPKCNNSKFHKHGNYKGGTRYKCLKCKKTFNELTGTSIHGIKKKHLLSRFVELMMDNKSIRYIAADLKISTKTVFVWRHKLLSSFDDLFTKEFKGIVETDDVYFRLNQKGRKVGSEFFIKKKKQRGISNDQVSVMVTMDRYKTYDFQLAKLGKITQKVIESITDKSRFNRENIICSDSNKSIINFYKEMDLIHKTFTVNKGEHVTEEIYHVNNLNNTVMRLKKWIKGNFSNVSTKYLRNYMNWFLMKEILKDKADPDNKWWDFMLTDNKSFDRNSGTEYTYLKLISAIKWNEFHDYIYTKNNW